MVDAMTRSAPVFFDELEGVGIGDIAVRVEKREYIGLVDVCDLAMLVLQVRSVLLVAGRCASMRPCAHGRSVPRAPNRLACGPMSWEASSAACSVFFT